MKPLISIIVPVYNVEKYVNQCIDSILNQTYLALEVILVDDGSLDHSGALCDRYALKDSRVKVIHKINGGLSSARNAGLDMATGTYIGFVDSDDWIAPSMYEELVHLLQLHEADVAQCGFSLINEKGTVTRKINYGNKFYANPKEIEEAFYITDGLSSVAWNKLYKAEIIEGLRFKVGKNNEDLFFLCDVLPRINSIVSTDVSYYYYLQRKESIMGAEFTEKKFDRLEAAEYLLERCLARTPQYENWARLEICKNCVFLYIDLTHSKNHHKREYRERIIATFNIHFQKIKSGPELKQARQLEKMLVYGFRVNKPFISHSYDLYRHIRG